MDLPHNFLLFNIVYHTCWCYCSEKAGVKLLLIHPSLLSQAQDQASPIPAALTQCAWMTKEDFLFYYWCYLLVMQFLLTSFIKMFTVPGVFSNSQVQFGRSEVCENASDLFLGAKIGKQESWDFPFRQRNKQSGSKKYHIKCSRLYSFKWSQ